MIVDRDYVVFDGVTKVTSFKVGCFFFGFEVPGSPVVENIRRSDACRLRTMDGGINRSIEFDPSCPSFIEAASLGVIREPKIFIKCGGEHARVLVENRSKNPDISGSLDRRGLGNQGGSNNAGEHGFRLPVLGFCFWFPNLINFRHIDCATASN